MRIFPASLRWRTLLVMVAALALSQAAAMWLLHVYVNEPRNQVRVGQFVNHLKTISAALNTMDAAQQQRFIAAIAEMEGIRISPVRGDEPMRPASDVVPVEQFRERIREIFGPEAEVYVRATPGPPPPRPAPVLWIRLPAGERGFWVAFPRGRIDHDPLAAVFVWGAAGLGIAIAATLFLVFWLNRPLSELALAAGKLGKGGNPPPVAETGPTEVRAVARAFNQMKEDLQKSERERATFLAGVSHDLRTPLSRLRLEVEMLSEGSETQRDMIQDLDDMNAIIDQFIDFSRSESAEPLERVDLVQLARACAERAARGGTVVRCELGDVPELRLRPLAMRRLIDNLIGNAARHAGGEIVVRTEHAGNEVRLSVLDRGPGIPPDLVERLKQPFTRRDAARSGSSGAGLGLAIADRVAALHSGRLDLLAREGGGLEARLTLPA